MPKSQADNSLILKMKTWLIYGRKYPTDAVPVPEIICTKVYAGSEISAKSQFWYKKNKLKLTIIGKLTESNINSRVLLERS